MFEKQVNDLFSLPAFVSSTQYLILHGIEILGGAILYSMRRSLCFGHLNFKMKRVT